MKKNFLLIITICLLLVSRCKEPDYPTYFIDQETKDYCVFKDSTWWVYEEINTKELDTHSVISYTHNLAKISHYSGEFELINCFYTRTRIGKNHRFKLFIVADKNKGHHKNILSNVEDCSSDATVFALLFYGAKDNHYTSDSFFHKYSGDTVRYLKYYDKFSLSSNGLIFDNVKVFQNSYTKSFEFFPRKTFWAKHVGIIRREMFDGSIWELKSYNIIQ